MNRQKEKIFSNKGFHRKALPTASPGKVTTVKVFKGKNNAKLESTEGWEGYEPNLGVGEGYGYVLEPHDKKKKLIPGGLMT